MEKATRGRKQKQEMETKKGAEGEAADLGLLWLMFYSLSTLCFREVRHKSNGTRRRDGKQFVPHASGFNFAMQIYVSVDCSCRLLPAS